MPTASALGLADAHRLQQTQIATATQAGLAQAWRLLDPQNLDRSFPTYLRAALAVVSSGRQMSHEAAIAYYGKAKYDAGLGTVLPLIPQPPMNLLQITTSLRVTGPVSIKAGLASGMAFEAVNQKALARTMGAGKRHVLNAGRGSLMGAVLADDQALGWARVSDGKPCAFCAMLVSRGPVYKSRATASFRSHDHCGCSVRPLFPGDPDGGWAPDALALRALWDSTPGTGGGSKGIRNFGKAYEEAYSDPTHPVFRTITDKIAGRVSGEAISTAKSLARSTMAEQALAAQRAAAAAEAEAKAAAQKALDEAAAAQAAAEAKAAALRKKWLGKPRPEKPVAPDKPKTLREKALEDWHDAVAKRFEDFAKATGNAKNDISKSNNYLHVQSVIRKADRTSLDLLLREKYVDQALYDAAVRAWGLGDSLSAADEAAYAKALRSYKNRMTRFDRYLREWREVNGVTAEVRGMDGALRHASNDEGVRWANANGHVPVGANRDALRTYSGSSFLPWNETLRTHADGLTVPPGKWESLTREADGAFAPLPEDVILHRGTTFMEFDPGDGSPRREFFPPPPVESLIGSVHTQHGYWSTSAGSNSAFAYKPVQLKLRAPAGTPAAWVMPYSKSTDEREMLLGRGLSFFVHDVYKHDGAWVVEAEIIPPGVDPKDYIGLPTQPSATRFPAR